MKGAFFFFFFSKVKIKKIYEQGEKRFKVVLDFKAMCRLEGLLIGVSEHAASFSAYFSRRTSFRDLCRGMQAGPQ